MIDMSKCSIFIRSKNCDLNFTAVRYSLHKWSETIQTILY